MALLLSDADVRKAADPLALVDVLASALQADGTDDVVVPARMNLERGDAWLRVMPAMVPAAGVMGLKVFHGVAPGSARYLISLYSMVSGELLALVDAAYLTAARTAATTALATRYLCRPGKLSVGLLGSGLEAEAHLEALAAVEGIAEVRVHSPNGERRQRFAERMTAALGVPVTACDDPRSTIADVEHVVVATNTGPQMTIACEAAWLQAGQHVSSIGSTNVRLRELETDVFRRADLVVVDAPPAQMAEESGDVIEYYAEGGSLGESTALGALVQGGATGRTTDGQLTLFKSVGTALQDVVAADHIYRRARELGLGIDVGEVCGEKFASSKRGASSVVTTAR